LRHARATGPPCHVEPGIYELGVDPKAPWKLSAGHPRLGTCETFADLRTAIVRIEPFGDALVATEYNKAGEQGFARGKTTWPGACELTLELALYNFAFDAKLTFAGDKLTGAATTASYIVFEDGTAGENQWTCAVTGAAMVGARLPD
jgi:hypothetical protein